MATSTCIAWLRTLKIEERTAFRSFLERAEYRELILPCRLFDWLVDHPALWETGDGDDTIDDETLYAHLYPDEAFKPQRLRRVQMELKELLEEFVAQIAPPQIPPELDRELRLLHHLLKRGANRLFLRQLEYLEKLLSETVEFSPGACLARAWLEEMRNEFLIHQQRPNDTFEAINEALDIYYLSRKLENFAAMRTRERQSAKPHHYSFQEATTNMLASSEIDEWPLVLLWKAVYALESATPSPQAFENVVTALAPIKQRLPLITLRQIRGYMFNHLASTQDLGNRAYYVRLWELLKEMLEEGVLHLPDRRMSSPFFLVTVRSACLSGNAVWASSFIGQNKAALFGESPEDLVIYCEMFTDFYAARYHHVWHRLMMFKPRELRLDVFTRTLQVQLAYELDKDDEYFRQVEALRKFILRCESLGQRFINLVLEFSRLAESLGKIKFGSGRLPKGFAARLDSIQTADKLWLKEKVAALDPKS